MSFLGNLKGRASSGASLLTILALLVLMAIAVGYLVFINSSVLPPLRVRQETAAQLASAEGQLLAALRAQDEGPDQLRTQLATAQAKLDETAQLFLNESQAAGVLDKIYQYADESGVEIIDLRTQVGSSAPEPVEATPEATPEAATEGTAEATVEGASEGTTEGTTDKKDFYDARMFQIQVQGAVTRLANFVSRIREAAIKSMIITNVNIIEGAEEHVLTMEIALYTSPYTSEPVEQPSDATPEPTPADLALLNDALTLAWESANWEQSINLIKQILLIDPAYDDMVEKLYASYVNYGHQLLEEGNTGGAVNQFDAALEIKPSGAEALAGLEIAVATPVPTLTVEEQLAQSLDKPWSEENWLEVIDIIEQILDINPDFDDMSDKLYAAHVNHGYQLAGENRLEEAKDAFIRALEINPEGGEAAAGLLALAQGTVPVPVTPQPPQPPDTIYVVKYGDTLFSIARRYNTTVQAIMSANGLSDYNIHVGQELRIPSGS